MCRIARLLELYGRSDLESGEYMRAAHWLEQAHVRYRQIPGMDDKAREVYELLRVAQDGTIGSMKTVDVPDMDVTELVEQARPLFRDTVSVMPSGVCCPCCRQ